jgi:hypothetical protein
MSDIDTVNNFNTVPEVLPYVDSFIGVVQSGRITLQVDQNNNYYASVLQFSPDTGQPLPNAVIPLNITAGLSNAAKDLGTLQTLLAQATPINQPNS